MAKPQTQHFEDELVLSAQSKPPSTPVPLQIAYRTYGSSSNAASRAVLLPSCFAGHLDDTLPFLYATDDGTEPVFSPDKYFVIVCGLLGGGESSSPSNTKAPFNGPNFPHTTYEDNIRLQHALCKHLGVEKLFAYCGFSMGGQQAYHMATIFPSFVDHMICIAGSARTSWHNWSFLEGPKAALTSSADFENGNYTKPPKKGLGAFGRVYSTWALSHEWYRQHCWEKSGHASLEAYLKDDWEDGMAGGNDANDLLCLLRTWQMGNICIYHPKDGDDLGKTLGRIQAKCLIMPSRTDTYFPPEDNAEEVKHLKNGKLEIIESIWGHLAGGGGGTKDDERFIRDKVRDFIS